MQQVTLGEFVALITTEIVTGVRVRVQQQGPYGYISTTHDLMPVGSAWIPYQVRTILLGVPHTTSTDLATGIKASQDRVWEATASIPTHIVRIGTRYVLASPDALRIYVAKAIKGRVGKVILLRPNKLRGVEIK